MCLCILLSNSSFLLCNMFNGYKYILFSQQGLIPLERSC